MKQWKIAVIALLSFCAGGVALAAGETNCPGQQPVSTVYEITVEKGGGTAEAVQVVKEAIEKREAFAASHCEEKVLGRGANAHLAYTCANSDSKTDQMFRETTVSQPGVKLTATAATVPGTSTSCPFGCRMDTTCTGGAYVTCCKIPAPLKKCATGSW